MTDRAASPTEAVANDERPSPATGKRGSGPTRELAQRLSGTDEVLLLWHPEIDRVELSVSDVTTGEGFHIEVAPGTAMDAFHHPYAYAGRRETAYHLVRAKTRIVDG
jgi:hypothetical protein